MHIFDSKTGKHLHTFFNSFIGKPLYKLRESDWLIAFGFHPSTQQLIGQRRGGEGLEFWNPDTGERIKNIKCSIVDEASGMFSINSDSSLIAGTCGSICLMDLQREQELPKLELEPDVNVLAFHPIKKNILAGGYDNGWIVLWDAIEYKEIVRFSGHTSPIFSLSFSADGRILSSSTHTQIILWDTMHGEELVSLIAVNDTDYIIATPDYYYMASERGLQGVAFRVGRRAYPFEQFDLKLNRPDIVLQRIGYASQELIESYHKAYQKRLKKMDFTEEMLGDDFHLPEIEILNRDALPISTTEKHLSFTIKTTDSKYLLDRLNVFVNDVPNYGTDGINLRDQKSSEHEQEITLELSNGRNKIQVSALNQKGVESLKETFEVGYTGQPVSPELYVIAVRVSEYIDTRRNLKYAAKDATDLVSFFQQHQQNFGKIHVATILDTAATKKNILAVKTLLVQTKVDDQVILFFAGHGLLDEQFDYYFATSDIDFTNPSKRGLPYEAIEGLLDGIPARKKLLLMDTCHSGEVDKEEVPMVAAAEISDIEDPAGQPRAFRGLGRVQQRQLGLQNSFELLRELFANLQRGSGAIVISSASGLEFAYESGRYRNGLFTYALLEGLQGQADTNADQVIQVSELRDYVTGKVQELTKNRQTPTVRRENLDFDFRVY